MEQGPVTKYHSKMFDIPLCCGLFKLLVTHHQLRAECIYLSLSNGVNLIDLFFFFLDLDIKFCFGGFHNFGGILGFTVVGYVLVSIM